MKSTSECCSFTKFGHRLPNGFGLSQAHNQEVIYTRAEMVFEFVAYKRGFCCGQSEQPNEQFEPFRHGIASTRFNRGSRLSK